MQLDNDIKHDVLSELKWDPDIDASRYWRCGQKWRRHAIVRKLRGVKGVSNMLALKPRVAPPEIKTKIEEAFRRSAEIDADRISVTASGGEVVLSGIVRSWAERHEAERTAWRASGVIKVENRITIAL